MSPSLVLSIIIPTHNRSAILMDNLAALSRQSWPANEFEVLVVADACQDDTAEMVAAYASQAPYRLRLLSHQAKSAAATRNLGAAHAQGRLLLFLDDDVVAQPGLVQAHLEAHNQMGVVLGYSKPAFPAKPSLWQRDARRWWEDTYREFGRPGHRFTYRDFFSGNVSLPAVLFRQVGGFDTSFTGRLEDYELGLRLLKEGVRFCYASTAVGHHYDNTDLVQWLRRVRQEGVADVQIGQRHPELRTSLFGHLLEPSNHIRRLLRELAFAYPQRGNRLEQLWLCLAALCERLRLRYRWRQAVWLLREYNYWRGVASVIGGQWALVAWLQEGSLSPSLSSDAPMVDLTALPSIEVLEGMLEQGHHQGVLLTVAGVEALTIPAQFGAEPLQVEHLHGALRNMARQEFVPALAWYLIRSGQGNPLCSLNLSNLI